MTKNDIIMNVVDKMLQDFDGKQKVTKKESKIYFCNLFIEKLKKKYPTYKMGYFKGYFMNLEKKKGILDGCFSHYRQYKEEEGVWTVNRREDVKRYKEKPIFVITDFPKYGR